jgi:hypothetical protein
MSSSTHAFDNSAPGVKIGVATAEKELRKDPEN